jgi:hypothetical protein
MNPQRLIIALLAVILSACSAINQETLPTEISLPTIEPTSTNSPITPTLEPTIAPSVTPTSESVQNGDVAHTVLKFEFPFEPAPPGYLVNIKSNVFTANLMCAVENGEILNLDENADASQKLGICDTSSMTLDVLISDEITVTVILGGFPVVNEVTKTPDAVTEQQAEYHFKSSLK